MNPKKIIEDTPPSKLAAARNMRQEHSSRDKPIFIKKVDKMVETFDQLGYTLEAKKNKVKNI